MSDTTITVKLTMAELQTIRYALKDRMQFPTPASRLAELRKLAGKLAVAQQDLAKSPID